ncbi:ABC transporter substrate-binding protein [Aliikangiella sp. G2MR2-5]|uniref:ABC transporter substrate-binding protein n=1 Tax=Aliikangiella sp. G2MR2-5 TaxID=2788943 RepID=UPI0018ABDE73|nr:ABC transporter substrate-binding protein [Aliikangiella sp. G2MR2-5]
MTIRTLFFTFLLLLTVACTEQAKTINIGILYNHQSNAGQSLLRASQMVEREIMEEQSNFFGPSRISLNLIKKDIGSTQESALVAFRELIKAERIDAIIGPTSSHQAIPIAKLADSLHLPMISPSSSHGNLTKGKKYVFRLAFTDEIQARALADFASINLNAKHIGVVYKASNSYSSEIASLFIERVKQIAGTKLNIFKYVSSEQNFQLALEKMKNEKVDLLFSPNFDQDVRRQMLVIEQLNWSVPILGSDSWHPENIRRRNPSLEAYYSHQWGEQVAADRAKSRAFSEAYSKIYDAPPTIVAALSYDALKLVVAVIKAVGNQPEAIRTEIANLEWFSGVSGDIRFRGDGTPIRPVYIFRIANEKIELHSEVVYE